MDHVEKILAQWQRERPDLNVAPMGIIGRIKRLHDRLMEELNLVYSSHGLNAASFDVLATLRRSGRPYALSPSALISWTMVTSGTMTNRLDRLESKGLIERLPDPKDGRGSIIALSKKGFVLIDQVVTEHVQNQHRLLSGIDAESREQLNTILAAWLAEIELKNPTEKT
ncbi:MAG: MarR family transcriptional regulator [Devosiaceae bacterium]|nr:MarR family transcriptional regulator [Devosiaceae bacterium]